MSKKKPLITPGAKEAIRLGCKCPISDNHHGKGYMSMDGIFVINESCKLHAKEKNK